MTTSMASSAVRELPRGIVTFLFTDIQGSTQLLHRLGDAYAEVLQTHRQLLREAFARHDGHEVDTQGDSFFVAFSSVREAIAAARESQQALYEYPWPHGEPVLVRMGLHTGEPLLVDGHYIGMDVHRAARIANSGHGGQVLVSARTLELSAGTPARDLGEHRLKDLEHPERIYQLEIDGLPDTFPALKTQGSPTNVPHHLSSLIGRSRERRELLELLVDPAVHVVTVTGTGGTGKTRLSAAVALDAMEHFPDGVYLVDLTTLSTEELVAPAIGRVLELEVDGEVPAEERLTQHLGRKKMLLMLDNFEQILSGAVHVTHILQACPGVKVLATSRVPLAIHGEHEYPLDTLSLPPSDSLADVSESDAVQMFVHKASQVRPTFRLTDENAAAVAQVCRLLDGLPLAIELAASRIKLFAPQALVRRLDDRLGLLSGGASDSPIRHRALRTTIDWSYDLLSPAERRFFCDLNVFSGGATYDAIEAVTTESDSDAGDVLEMLTSLVNHSLVRQREDDETEARFHMLHVLRDYALEVANRDPEHQHDVRERHAQHFLALARRVRGVGKGLSPQEAALDLEADNLRAALDFWLADAAAGIDAAGDKALSLAASLGFHWYYHGQAREGARRLEAALAAAVDPPKDDLALAIRMLGVMVQHLGQAERAIGLLERGVALHQEIGDRSGEAACLNSLGAALRVLMRFAEAEQRLSEAAVVREELGEPGGLIAIHNNLGLLYMDQGRVAEAKVLFADNLVLDRQRDDAWGAACSMLNLGAAHLVDGEAEEARALVAGAIDAFVEVEDADGLVEILEACVGLAAAQKKWATGMRLAGAAAAFRELLGLVAPEPDRVMIDRWISRCRENLDPKAFAQARVEGTEMTVEQATAYARSEVLAPPPT